MIKESFQNLSKFEKRIGYSFVDKNLIKEALTHSSLKMTNVKYNERLEFLGDAVLKQYVSLLLFKRFPDSTEGKLTKIRAKIIADVYLSEIAKSLELGSMLFLSYGEESNGGEIESLTLLMRSKH